MSNVVIQQKCIKRILLDLKNIDSKLLNSNNIYYSHDEDNILKGYAMIIGPEDTVYDYGYYFFEFFFTSNYPFEPPIVKFKTHDGITRFHPNLYRNGKVCLSILNTWRGESWSSCLTLTTILLTLVTLFTKTPILSEPGIDESYKYFNNYHKIITYKNIDHSILYYLNPEHIENNFKIFFSVIEEKFKENRDKILNICKLKLKEKKKDKYIVDIYSMNQVINYDNLIEKINKIDIK